jgi:hypothetical protein
MQAPKVALPDTEDDDDDKPVPAPKPAAAKLTKAAPAKVVKKRESIELDLSSDAEAKPSAKKAKKAPAVRSALSSSSCFRS